MIPAGLCERCLPSPKDARVAFPHINERAGGFGLALAFIHWLLVGSQGIKSLYNPHIPYSKLSLSKFTALGFSLQGLGFRVIHHVGALWPRHFERDSEASDCLLADQRTAGCMGPGRLGFKA